MFFNVRICLKLWEKGLEQRASQAGYYSENGEVSEENLVLRRATEDLPAYNLLDVLLENNAIRIFGKEEIDGMPKWRFNSQILLETWQQAAEKINDVMMDLLNMPKTE